MIAESWKWPLRQDRSRWSNDIIAMELLGSPASDSEVTKVSESMTLLESRSALEPRDTLLGPSTNLESLRAFSFIGGKDGNHHSPLVR
jgi:hypothetical protein